MPRSCPVFSSMPTRPPEGLNGNNRKKHVFRRTEYLEPAVWDISCSNSLRFWPHITGPEISGNWCTPWTRLSSSTLPIPSCLPSISRTEFSMGVGSFLTAGAAVTRLKSEPVRMESQPHVRGMISLSYTLYEVHWAGKKGIYHAFPTGYHPAVRYIRTGLVVFFSSQQATRSESGRGRCGSVGE